MSCSGAARQRRYYRRQKLGKMLLTLEIDHFIVSEMLIARGLLLENEIDDRGAIAAGLQKMLTRQSFSLASCDRNTS
jgi:hypothetical protein